MRIPLHIFLLAICLSLTTSCLKQEGFGGRVPDGEPVELVLSYTAPEPQVIVPTKATLGLKQESTIYNMYVFIFDKPESANAPRKKIYGKYFDASNLQGKTDNQSEYWTAPATTGGEGTVHVMTVSRTNCIVVVIANIDAEMVNISPEQLSLIQTYEDLVDTKATLNQLIVSRSGYFPMTGELTGFNTGEERSPVAKLTLHRLDAKIMFNVRVGVDGNNVCKIADFIPEKWQVVNIPKSAYIMEKGHYFDAQSSLIDATGASDDDYFDLPETNFETQALKEGSPKEYYAPKDGESANARQIVTHGFSFYMMENRKAPKEHTGDWTYGDRELQEKSAPVNTDEGRHSSQTNGAFKYAPEKATYVVITGQLLMRNVTYQPTEGTAESTGATLSANVQYIVHLGNFGASEDPNSSLNPPSITGSESTSSQYADFNVFRNHTYVYDITILDVNSIRVEVECNEDSNTGNNLLEPAPGATGQLTVAMEDIFPCDAHYCSHVINFHAKYIDPHNMTWRVQTPFNPSGASPKTTTDAFGNITENITGVDCGWVEFRVNLTDQNGYYLSLRREYQPLGDHPDGKTMSISELVDYLKKQKEQFEDDLIHLSDDEFEPLSDFDGFYDSDGNLINDAASIRANAKISVTAFINEYYYELNPITHDYQTDLWKKFVNQPMRYMYILSNTKLSADGESEIIGSSFTIQQKSIQSIYNMSHPELNSAWGCEHEDDDYANGITKYSPDTGNNRGNDSAYNGRTNSLKEWGLLKKSGNKFISILGEEDEREARWDHYMNLTADNETPLMRGPDDVDDGGKGFRYLRYSCMSRNRDNNGNGVIDEEEVRWYMGATNQLIGLYMGDYGLEGDARIYQRGYEQQLSTATKDWRQHVIASTRWTGSYSDGTSDKSPRVIWAEQRVCGSTLRGSELHAEGLQDFTTRCVRNLGSYYNNDKGETEDITFAPVLATSTQPEVVPEDYIVVSRLKNGQPYSGTYNTDVYYVIDCSRLNEKSLRYYTNRELAMHDEQAEQACLYKKFQTAPVKDSPTFSSISCDALNTELDNTIEHNRFCPPGYRLCNLREATVLQEFITDASFRVNYNVTRTYWSFGQLGKMYNKSRKGTDKAYVFATSTQKILMGEKGAHSTTTLRCVKDIKD